MIEFIKVQSGKQKPLCVYNHGYACKGFKIEEGAYKILEELGTWRSWKVLPKVSVWHWRSQLASPSEWFLKNLPRTYSKSQESLRSSQVLLCRAIVTQGLIVMLLGLSSRGLTATSSRDNEICVLPAAFSVLSKFLSLADSDWEAHRNGSSMKCCCKAQKLAIACQISTGDQVKWLSK